METEAYGDACEIRRGASYIVFRARRARDHARVVIKTPSDERSLPEARGRPLARSSVRRAAARLRREYEILSGLDAPGVVKPLELQESREGLPALVLEDAGQQTLKDWLRRRVVGVDVFLPLAIELAEIVARIHERNLIHGDVNPLNVVMDDGDHPTLVDFDRATSASGITPSAGALPELEGTLSYISPEQTGRMNRLVDQRSDLYSLGATFYEMLTGGPPFALGDPVELVHAHLAKEPVPPAQIDPSVPVVLSDIVLKLLRKMPEERYQSAAALLADLKEAHRLLKTTGTVPPFELDLVDMERELPLPDKLYGRDEVLAELDRAFDRVVAGAHETWLVTGPTGIGKSVLVQQLRGRVAGARGRFLSGKFDIRRGNEPYLPFAWAFRDWVRLILAENEVATAQWRDRIQRAVEPNGALLIDLVPELERLLGPQPAVPNLGPAETENRFHLVLRAFVQTVAGAEHPLVVFVDDLQWADSASLKVLSTLASDPDIEHLLIVGAFRTGEDGHPLLGVVDSLRAAGAMTGIVELGPLDIAGVSELCCDALRCSLERGLPLSELVLRKTTGNPLFIKRLLRSLHQAKLLAFTSAGTWEWDLSQIERVGVADDVAVLLLGSFRRLPEATQNVLKIVACIGSRADLSLVAALAGQAPDVTLAKLWDAIREGLVVSLDTLEEGAKEVPSYQFAHDRVQQVAYSLLTESEKRHLHLEVGRRLAERIGEGEVDSRIFEAVDHLNLGEELVADENERSRLAELNLRAARKARKSSAYGPALAYLRNGIAFLPRKGRPSPHDLAFSLYRDALECAYFVGDRALADDLFRDAWTYAESRFEKAELHDVRVVAFTVKNAFADAIHAGREGLALLGVDLPETRIEEAVEAELATVRANLKGRPIETLLDAPPMLDPEHRVCARILSNLFATTYINRQDLYPFVVVRLVNLSLVQGTAKESPFAYAAFGVILASVTGDYSSAHMFGRLGSELARRLGDPAEICRALGIFGAFVNNWRAPARSSLPLLREAVQKGLESGQLQYANYWGASIGKNLLYRGVELALVLVDVEAALALARRTGVRAGQDWNLALRQAVRCLQGHTNERDRFDDANFDEKAYLEELAGDPFAIGFYYVARLQVSYLFGDLESARQLSASLRQLLEYQRGSLSLVDHTFYTALTLLSSSESAPAQKEAWVAQAADAHRKLEVWAATCPDNFRQKELLVSAELARIEGRTTEAEALYDEAIEAARGEAFLQDEALGNELAARFYRARGRKRIAALYLSAAIRCYLRWGATAKVDALEQEFFDLEWREALAPLSSATLATDQGSSSFDLRGILKAAEAISSEMVMDRLLERLAGVCLAMAGAERGALLLGENGRLVVRVVASIGQPCSIGRTPFEESDQVPHEVIRRALAMANVLVVGDAAHGSRFASDPYVAKHNVRSVLVVPIRRQAKRIGLLYLENRLATSIFTPDRVRVLRLLSSQIAISLDNSALFEKLSDEVDERRRAEAALRLLADAGAALVESLDYETTLVRLAALTIPSLADWCIVDLLEEGGAMRRVAAKHVDASKAPVLAELQERYPPDWSSPHPSARVLRSGAPLLHRELPDEVLRTLCVDDEHVRLIRALGARSGLAVPLLARGQTLGVLTLTLASPTRRYGPRDVELAQEVARRAATAIDNARLYRNAQEAIRVRDDFLSIASHELRTPITSLQLAVESLLRGLRRERAISPEMLAIAARQTERLTALIGQMLDVTRIQGGKLTLTLEEFDFVANFRRILERAQVDIERAKAPLTLHAGDAVIGHWDRLRIDQLLTNILSNALSYGGGRPIDVTIERVGDRVRFAMCDQGIGIAADRLPHIFERFERATSTRHYGGLGLGLFIARQIVQAHHGTVTAESELGRGSCFTVELPLRPPEEAGP